MVDIVLRPGKPADAADITILDNIAGYGISLWFWKREVESGNAEDALALGRQRLGEDDNFYGWRSATLAQKNGIVQGVATSYIMPGSDEEVEDIKRTAPAFAPVYELFDKAKGDWFLDTLAIYPDARGQGIGGMLLDHSIETGKSSEARQMSLVVQDDNENALKLYKSRGFEVKDSKLFIEFDGPSQTKNWLLMTAQL